MHLTECDDLGETERLGEGIGPCHCDLGNVCTLHGEDQSGVDDEFRSGRGATHCRDGNQARGDSVYRFDNSNHFARFVDCHAADNRS